MTALSCVIVVLDFTILKIVIFIGRFRRGSPRVNRWIQDGALQLQRRAYEAAGEGAWTRLEESNPVTTTGELLDELPISSQHTCCMASPPKEGTIQTPSEGSTSLTAVTTVDQQAPMDSTGSVAEVSEANEAPSSNASVGSGEIEQRTDPLPVIPTSSTGGRTTA